MGPRDGGWEEPLFEVASASPAAGGRVALVSGEPPFMLFTLPQPPAFCPGMQAPACLGLSPPQPGTHCPWGVDPARGSVRDRFCTCCEVSRAPEVLNKGANTGVCRPGPGLAEARRQL